MVVKGAKFSCLFWDGRPKEDLYFKYGEDFVKLVFPGAGRTHRYPLGQEGVFHLYRKVEVKEGDKFEVDLEKGEVKVGGVDVGQSMVYRF